MRTPPLPLYASNQLRELMELLGGYALANPSTQDRELFRLSCSCKFEGFGRASESFDLVWTLTLPHIRRYFVQPIPGTRRSAFVVDASPSGVAMSFKGRDDAECMTRAIAFLKSVPHPVRIDEPVTDVITDIPEREPAAAPASEGWQLE